METIMVEDKLKKKIKKLKRKRRELEEQFASQQDMLAMTTAHMRRVQEELEASQKRLTATHKQVLDSIFSAERIQKAMLNTEEKVKEAFPKSFLIYIPKNILSGDFYWLQKTSEYVFMAAIDCTGHGVPGAMLTVLANSLLDQIVVGQGLREPEQILKQLDALLAYYTHQEGRTQQVNDGLDISLIRWEARTGEVLFSGAHHPLFHVQNGVLSVHKGNRYSIGSNRGHIALNASIQMEPGDMIYLCSDGFADQFGGASNRKFTIGKLREKLQEAASMPIEAQRDFLLQQFLEWKGDFPQTDDVMVIGLQF